MGIAQAIMQGREELETSQRLEQLRRQGHEFIKVIYKGFNPAPVFDGSGDVINIRIKEVHDVVLVEKISETTGLKEYTTALGTRELKFHRDNITGDVVSYVFDDEYNRQFLKSVIEFGIEPVDPKMKMEIRDLVGNNFQVEVSREEEIQREITALQKERDRIVNKKRLEASTIEDLEQRKKRKPNKRAAESDALNEAEEAKATTPEKVENGNDKSALDLD